MRTRLLSVLATALFTAQLGVSVNSPLGGDTVSRGATIAVNGMGTDGVTYVVGFYIYSGGSFTLEMSHNVLCSGLPPMPLFQKDFVPNPQWTVTPTGAEHVFLIDGPGDDDDVVEDLTVI